MNATIKTRVENFLNSLNTEIDVLSLVDVDSIDFSDAYNSIEQMIVENDGFDVEVIYYSSAMQYLMDNDPSLQESMELASDLGYSLENINSELLASLLKSENVKNGFYELVDEINEFFWDLEEEDEEEDEDEDEEEEDEEEEDED